MSRHARTLGPDWRRMQMRQTQNGVVLLPEDQMTRQRQRQLIRMGSFDRLAEKYGGEPRKRRRLMGIRSARRTYQIAAEELRNNRKTP